jgi:hypothetical protein
MMSRGMRWAVFAQALVALTGCYSQMEQGGGGGGTASPSPSPSPFYGPSPDTNFPYQQ